jgi:hypothetical protein
VKVHQQSDGGIFESTIQCVPLEYVACRLLTEYWISFVGGVAQDSYKTMRKNSTGLDTWSLAQFRRSTEQTLSLAVLCRLEQ